MSRHSALIWISINFLAGQSKLRELVHDLQKIGDIPALSSIYKNFLSARLEDLNSNLVLVLKLDTKLDSQEIFVHLQKMAAVFSAQVIILAFDQEIRMVPGKNLPQPQLHADPLTLRCASEAWGEYHHPVLGQTLNEIVRLSDSPQNAAFFAQGLSLFSAESS
jgi:hypothetical protein